MSQPNPKNIQPSAQPVSLSGDHIPPDGHESIPLTEASKLMVQRGVTAARQGQRDEAIRQFDQALSINEDDIEALLWRGGLSEPNESLPFLERALALDPTNQRVRRGLESGAFSCRAGCACAEDGGSTGSRHRRQVPGSAGRP